MPSIKFNLSTKEIEVKGSESFIDSNFNKIQKLLIESFGVKKIMALGKTKNNRETISLAETKASRPDADEISRYQISGPSQIIAATELTTPEIAHDLRAKRPPLRKYIRKEGAPGHQRIVVEVAEQKQTEISVASLKEKFGLSEAKIGGIIRDAEKLGKIKRVVGGSYSWT